MEKFSTIVSISTLVIVTVILLMLFGNIGFSSSEGGISAGPSWLPLSVKPDVSGTIFAQEESNTSKAHYRIEQIWNFKTPVNSYSITMNIYNKDGSLYANGPTLIGVNANEAKIAQTYYEFQCVSACQSTFSNDGQTPTRVMQFILVTDKYSYTFNTDFYIIRAQSGGDYHFNNNPIASIFPLSIS